MNNNMFKIKKIKEAIKSNNVDELKNLGKRHGFINAKLRKKCWPMILGKKLNQEIDLNQLEEITTKNLDHEQNELYH